MLLLLPLLGGIIVAAVLADDELGRSCRDSSATDPAAAANDGDNADYAADTRLLMLLLLELQLLLLQMCGDLHG